MQQFIVPQFIDIESKILGPITTRQFLWVMAAGLIFFVALRTLSTGIFIIVVLLDALVFGSFAFIKVNGQLFHNFLLNFIQFWRRPRLYIWSMAPAPEAVKAGPATKVAPVMTPPPLAAGRLNELSLMVDTGGIYKPIGSLKESSTVPENVMTVKSYAQRDR